MARGVCVVDDGDMAIYRGQVWMDANPIQYGVCLCVYVYVGVSESLLLTLLSFCFTGSVLRAPAKQRECLFLLFCIGSSFVLNNTEKKRA